MDIKTEDTMNDSDSGSSRGSWVFVDEINPQDVNAPNQFYLNCLGEPVQELTENDLGVVDCDSDSDGISVISETDESLKESSCDDSTQDFFTKSCDETNEVVDSIGFQDRFAEVAAAINENGINLKKLFITSSLIGAGVVVVAILIAPYITPKASNDISINDVSVEMPRKYHTNPREPTLNYHCKKEHKKKRLTFEKTHNESKTYGKREFDTRSRHFENDYPVKYSAEIKHANSVEREGEDLEEFFIRHNKKSKKRNKHDLNGCDDFRSKQKKLKIKEEYLAKKEEYLIKKEYELLRTKIKLQKKLEKLKHSEKNQRYYKIEYNVKTENQSDGEWYINFHKHREDVRKRDHMADWLFDRANDRSKRRDEARWYFHWMIGRQEGRFKRPLRRHHA